MPNDTGAPATASAQAPAKSPTFDDLIATAKAVFNTGVLASDQQAKDLRGIVDKLLKEGHGGSLDFSDSANSSQIPNL